MKYNSKVNVNYLSAEDLKELYHVLEQLIIVGQDKQDKLIDSGACGPEVISHSKQLDNFVSALEIISKVLKTKQKPLTTKSDNNYSTILKKITVFDDSTSKSTNSTKNALNNFIVKNAENNVVQDACDFISTFNNTDFIKLKENAITLGYQGDANVFDYGSNDENKITTKTETAQTQNSAKKSLEEQAIELINNSPLGKTHL